VDEAVRRQSVQGWHERQETVTTKVKREEKSLRQGSQRERERERERERKRQRARKREKETERETEREREGERL
jgi:hypothetical protein